MRSLVVLVALCSFCGFFPTWSEAVTLRVPQDYPTIQAGINAAAGGDIVLVANGSYVGVGNRDLNFNGKMITVRSENGFGSCTIDCLNSGRGFLFQNGETANSVVEGFTIINGNATHGGGIYCTSSSPTIRNSMITRNTSAGTGGGISAINSALTISRCRICNNTAASYGGGIFFENCSAASITNTFITCNNAGFGAGLYLIDSSPPITNNTISTNYATSAIGGGLYLSWSSPAVTNCILYGDTGTEIHLGLYSTPAVTYCDVQFGFPGTGNIDCPPGFVGGTDFHLLPSSCCQDTGTCAGAPDIDYDGDPRPYGAGCDIGADEYVQPTPTPTLSGSPTATPTWTPTPIGSPTPTWKPTLTPTMTPSPTSTNTPPATPTPLFSPTEVPEETPTVSPSPTPSCEHDGDVNGDGQVTVGDAQSSFFFYMDCELNDPAVWEYCAADYCGAGLPEPCDGSVTPGDALAILKVYLLIPDPCGT